MTQRLSSDRPDHAAIALLSVFALAVHGFHPYAEDGGLYVAGVKKVLNPRLYAARPEFVDGHLRFSLFAPLVAALVRLTHLPLDWLLPILYAATVWLTLLAGWMLASRFAETQAGRRGAIALLACWLTLPIAGTSLMLIDPYVTARSLSTPMVLIALAWALDALLAPDTRTRTRIWTRCLLLLLATAALHPLMAGYGLAAVILLAASATADPRRRHRTFLALALGAVLAATLIQLAAPPESPAYLRVEFTRSYWFPSLWAWYELVGVVAPLVVVLVLARSRHTAGWTLVTRMALALGLISLLIALLFSRPGLATHLVARLQPLRSFQIVYEVMILLLGAWLGERWLKHHVWRWAGSLTALGTLMFFVQASIFPASAHFEIPGRPTINPWVQAFEWVRANTPPDALFALDAHYITRDGEDAQSFRGIAVRAMLPDYSKDGGEASIAPPLADAWIAGQAAQTHLNRQSDEIRESVLKPLGVTWVLLDQTTQTAWSCPYRNATVKVCRLP